MSFNARAGLIQAFSQPKTHKVGEAADPRFPPPSATMERWDKVSSKSLGSVHVPKPKTAAQIRARIQPKVIRHAAKP